jgi:uncharacterized protein YkwD
VANHLSRYIFKFEVYVLIFFFCVGLSVIAPGTFVEAEGLNGRSDQSREELERLILKWTNQERVSRKLPMLRTNVALGMLAQAHSQDQARVRLMAHNSDKFPKGRQTFDERMKTLQFPMPVTFGENIFWTSEKFPASFSGRDEYAHKIVRAWMNSPGHRKNILNPEFKSMGIGFSDGYVTQLFSSRQHVS